VHIVHTETALDAQAAFVGGTGPAFDTDNLFVFHLEGDEAAHATEGTNRIDLAVHLLCAHVALGHERACGAGLHTFATGHTAALPHGVGQIEDHLRVRAAVGQTDHVIDLQVAAGAFAAVALDAGIQVHGHGRMRHVGRYRLAAQLGQGGAHLHTVVLGPLAQLTMRGLGAVVKPFVTLFGQVGQQHLQHHLLALEGAFAVGLHLHARRGAAAATGGQRALAFNFNHAGTAVAVWRETVLVAQVGNLDAEVFGDVENALTGWGGDRLAVESEVNRRHARASWLSSPT